MWNLLQFVVYMACVKKLFNKKMQYIELNQAKKDCDGKTEEEQVKILTDALTKKRCCMFKGRKNRMREAV